MKRDINISTQVDDSGARLGLYREPNESINAFQLRIQSCLKYGLKQNKSSFEDSFDYLTSNRTKNIALVEPNNVSAFNKSISFDGYFITIDEEKFSVEDYKFLKDFYLLLSGKGFKVTQLKDMLLLKALTLFGSTRAIFFVLLLVR